VTGSPAGDAAARDAAVREVTVRVPATSANLGPGFDTVGLALTLYDEVTVRVMPGGLSIEVSGAGAHTADAGEKHLVVRAMRAAFAAAGWQPPGLALRCVNRIPHSRGLGSSAAAIVAGVIAARALAPDGDQVLDDDAVFDLAVRIEGHPDNVAACLAGGLTIAWQGAAGPRLSRLSPLPTVVPVVCIAPRPLATERARQALPETVPHADAAANAGRSALLVAALTADPAALLDATRDWLHQPYRAPVMPDTAELVSRLRAAGIPAATSGAGPSVIAFLAQGSSPGLGVLGSIVSETGTGWLVSPLDVDRQGASIRPGPPDANSGSTTQQNLPQTLRQVLRRAWSGCGQGQVRPGSAAQTEQQDRLSSSATHPQHSREYGGLRWC
jgi:homoserine kinase